MNHISSHVCARDEAEVLSDKKKKPRMYIRGSEFQLLSILYAWKLLPHPQVLVALGFLNTNPRAITSSLKSISVPLR